MNITDYHLTTLKETIPNIIMEIDLDNLRENEKYLTLMILLCRYIEVHGLQC